VAGTRQTFDSMTGEVHASWSAELLPGGTAWVACKNRRASICEACSRVYQYDAHHLIVTGLRGGKTVPATVEGSPAKFVTLTAPSFGPVHTVDAHGGCLPRRDPRTCDHGVPMVCHHRHGDDDPQLGQPICVDCFDYLGAVLWNASASELFRRWRIGVYRSSPASRASRRRG